jgi:hypothetical protein
MKHVALLALVAALAAACGSTTHRSASTTSTAPAVSPKCANHPVTAAQKREYRRILRILAQMHRATTHDAESRLTDRFLLAEETSGLPNYVRNRLIDHAVAYATPKCQDCFQALEAARPIVHPCAG